MIQEELKNKEKDIKGITRQACSLLDTAWTKGYVAGFNDGYATRREADKEAYKRPKGKWKIKTFDEEAGIHRVIVIKKGRYFCTCCGKPKCQVYSDYCANCGADMRGGQDNGKC